MPESYGDWLRSKNISIHTKNKTRHQYGSEAPSKFIPAKNGRDNILVMSEGALEQSEVDYLVEAEQYKEDERIKKGRVSRTQKKIQKLIDIANSVPKGERRRAMDESGIG